jgi:hypothetical protein
MKEEKDKKNYNNIAVILVCVLIAFGGGFFIGKSVAGISNAKRGSQYTGMRNGQPTGTGQRLRNGFRPINGEIISADDKSVTVKLADGSSKIVLLSDKTQINKAEMATVKDLTAGQKIMVVGQDNPDGSVSATNIQLNPILRQENIPNPKK